MNIVSIDMIEFNMSILDIAYYITDMGKGLTYGIIGIAIVFLLVMSMLYYQETNYQFQIAKIKALEEKYAQKEIELNYLRQQTAKCPVPNLTDPRSCYFGSNYACSWNETIGRCDLIQ